LNGETEKYLETIETIEGQRATMYMHRLQNYMTALVDELPNRVSPEVPRGWYFFEHQKERHEDESERIDDLISMNMEMHDFTSVGSILKNLVSLATIRAVHGIGKLRFKPS